MNFFLRVAAYIFHPLLMPLLGVFLYYGITPRFVEIEIMQAKLITVTIITFFIPIVAYFLLKNIGVLSSVHLEKVDDRKVPLMIQCVLLLLVIKMVFDPYDNPELYYFFVGILFSSIATLLLVFLKFKVSIHQMGVAGLTMFLIALGIHFKVNVLFAVSLFFIANGWVGSSRLHTKSHTTVELIGGFFIGVLPQLLMINFWL